MNWSRKIEGCCNNKMFLTIYGAILLWRIDGVVESTKVVKNNMRYQTTLPLSRVGPTASLRDVEPNFVGPIDNVTVALGREAVLTCSVADIGDYKVAWIRADDQTILTLHTRLVTHSSRYAVTNDSPGSWQLHIRPLKVEDRGCYMCQINTSTMKKQIGCVDVLVPPNIIDEGTSGDIVAREGTHVSISCKADGRPLPRILWRREDGTNIQLRNDAGKLHKVDMYTGPSLNLTKVERRQMGAYLCIASNDVPPSVSKRIMLNVNFGPSIMITTKVIGVPTGSQTELQCLVEAYPPAINYWLKSGEEMILSGGKHEIREVRLSAYEIRTVLTVTDFNSEDIGTYTCFATNTIGKAEGTLRLYEIKITTTSTTTTTTSTTSTTTATTPALTTTDLITAPPFLVPLQPAEQKFYTPDVTTYVDMYTGPSLNLTKVERRQMGAYLCIASNDVPPSVSKRIILNVNFGPSIMITTKVIGVPTGSQTELQCLVEAFPPAINYWLKSGEEMILSGGKHEIREVRLSAYEIRTVLTVTDFNSEDIGTYTCFATNTIGKAEGTLRLYEIKITTTSTTTTTTSTTSTTTATTPALTTTDLITAPPFLVPLQPAEQKFYTPDVTTYDTMQNVIEQSVLDNNWLPTAESSSNNQQALCFPSLAFILVLPKILFCIIRSLKLLIVITLISCILIIQGTR